VNLLWRYYGGPPDRRLIAWTCAVLFFPDPVAFRMSQFSPIILAGLVAFLHCMRAQRRLIAGVSLFVLGIKPQ
jgi:hypothetical protein